MFALPIFLGRPTYCRGVGTVRWTVSATIVLDIVKAFGEVWGAPINYKIAARRPGDISECYADPAKAYEVLGWRAERDLKKMCEDSARWQKMNPDGYPD